MKPTKLDLSVLPEKYSNNWHIYLTVRENHRINYSMIRANLKSENMHSDEWVLEFDAATKEWLELNPADPKWVLGDWPVGAAVFLGNDATIEAISIIEKS